MQHSRHIHDSDRAGRRGAARAAALAAAVVLAVSAPTRADAVSFIRDTEIEDTIRAYASPLLAAAGLNAGHVGIYVIIDRQINAFVAGGQRIFINTGLLTRARGPETVIGVLAHEMGHILGGHLARTRSVLDRAQAIAIASAILGGVAAAASGQAGAGAALGQGGSQLALGTLLAYSRAQESAADQAAFRLLEATGQSARGLVSLLDMLGDADLVSTSRDAAYARTHPSSRDRVQAAEQAIDRSPHADVRASPALQRRHERMVAKLRGFLDHPRSTLQRYPTSDDSVPARYARAIAYHRNGQRDEAIDEVDSLIDDDRNDPYFHELRGQILFESGDPRRAVESYRRAVQLAPNAPLIRVGLAQAELALDDPSQLSDAQQQLRRAVQAERDFPLAWHLLAIAEGKSGDIGSSALALAEEAMVSGRADDAISQAKRAKHFLGRGTPGWLRADDIEHEAKRRQ